jgi:hypothetical protein
MPWMSIIGIGASLIGGASQADAAGRASDAQAASAKEANDAAIKQAQMADATQRYFYNTNRQDNSAFLNNGRGANNKLAYLLGVNPTQSQPQNALMSMSRDQIRSQLLPQYTTGGPSAGGNFIGNMFDGNMTPAQRMAMSRSNGSMIGPRNGSADAYYAPDAGNNATVFYGGTGGTGGAGFGQGQNGTVDEAALQDAIDAQYNAQLQNQNQFTTQGNGDNGDGQFGSLLRKFGQSDLEADPVYQNGLKYGLDQGVQGINRMASANGGADSGAILKALARFGNDYGTTKAEGSYNRYKNDQGTTYNMLAGLGGAGQTASGQVGQAGMNAGNNISASQIGLGNTLGQNAIGVGNARAASMIGGANALAGGFTNAYNGYQQQNMFNQLMNRNNTTPYDFGSDGGAGGGGMGYGG